MNRLAITLPLILLFSCSKEVSPTQPPVEGEGGITAKYKLAAVERLALSADSTLKLMAIGTDDMKFDGTARSWSFEYSRTTPPFDRSFFTATFDTVSFDSVSSSVLVGDAIITEQWINSSDAAGLAEGMGGKGFRSGNPDFSISAHLGEPVIPNPVISWYIIYHSQTQPEARQTFTIDARPAVTIW